MFTSETQALAAQGLFPFLDILAFTDVCQNSDDGRGQGREFGTHKWRIGVGRLTALLVKNAAAGSKLLDGDGLRLDVDRNGHGRWFFRFTSPISRRERLMGLGPARDVSLAEARDLAALARLRIRRGEDPIESKRAEREAAQVEARKAVTFRSYADTYVTSHESAWKNPVHRRAWRSSLRDHVFPKIGHIAVSDVSTEEVIEVLQPIWSAKKEAARAVRQRIETILAAAKVEGLRTGENPAQWKGHLDHLLPRHKRTQRHHHALPYAELPEFWRSLSADTSDTAALLRFTIATVARYSEAANATWSEINKETQTWTIPAARMKAGCDHVVPLNADAIAALSKSRTDSGLVFPSSRSGKKISDVALAKVIRRHTRTAATTHGFRSTFRDWAGDRTDYPREVAEAALAHSVGNAVEAAYRRGTALEKRRALMELWSRFTASGCAPVDNRES